MLLSNYQKFIVVMLVMLPMGTHCSRHELISDIALTEETAKLLGNSLQCSIFNDYYGDLKPEHEEGADDFELRISQGNWRKAGANVDGFKLSGHCKRSLSSFL